MFQQTLHGRTLALFLAALGFLFLTGPEPSQAQGSRMLRMPTVSTTHIAFVTANDIWVVPRGGEMPFA